jgi:HSP20 family protein
MAQPRSESQTSPAAPAANKPSQQPASPPARSQSSQAQPSSSQPPSSQPQPSQPQSSRAQPSSSEAQAPSSSSQAMQQGRGSQAPSGRAMGRDMQRVSSPFEMMRRLSRDFDRLFGAGFGGFDELFDAFDSSGPMAQAWSPQLEVFQNGNELVVRADLPGMKKDDVHVELLDDRLVISGERRSEESRDENGWYRSERSYGSFRRAIPLPAGVSAEKTRASFNDGVLEVRVEQPQQPGRQRQRIEIGGGASSSGANASGATRDGGADADKPSGEVH